MILKPLIDKIRQHKFRARPVLELTDVVREGRKVIATEVASKRQKFAHARKAVKLMQADPLRRAGG